MKKIVSGCATAIVALMFSCSPKSNNCNMAADAGMCMAAIPRYYVNQQTGQCEQFTWGGCGNFPFETMQACETACE
jgi:hypothetical protein